MEPTCPVARTPGVRVKPVTVASLVQPASRPCVAGRDWSYCPDPDCEVVYYAGDGTRLELADLTVAVGAKRASAPPRLVCYCFGHTRESVREELDRTGESTVVDAVTAMVRAGRCHCETMNPKGSCCLRDLRRVAAEAAS